MKLKTRIKLLWDKLWIREDEFDKSLNMDGMLMCEMTPEEFYKYQVDLVKRRNKAHEKDFKKTKN